MSNLASQRLSHKCKSAIGVEFYYGGNIALKRRVKTLIYM